MRHSVRCEVRGEKFLRGVSIAVRIVVRLDPY